YARAVRAVKDFDKRTKFEESMAGVLPKSTGSQLNVAVFARDRIVHNDIELVGAERPANALDNTGRKTEVQLGAEWIAVPFIEDTSKGNVAIRYSIALEHHKYVSPESYDVIKETFARHIVQVYLSKHYNKVDVNLGLGAFHSSFRDK